MDSPRSIWAKRHWTTAVALAAATVGVALLGATPRHAGWWLAGVLIVFGLLVGWPALVLPFVVFVVGVLAVIGDNSNCAYECHAGWAVVYVLPFSFVPVLIGIAI